MGFPAFEMEKKIFQIQENPFKHRVNRENSGVISEVTQKLCGKFHFKIRKSRTKLHIKLHIKVRKPHFKLRKALFKIVLERNCKNKNVLEFDLEKDDKSNF